MRKLTVSDFDHPIVFVFAMVLVIVPILALMNLGAARLGLPGPSALIRNAA